MGSKSLREKLNSGNSTLIMKIQPGSEKRGRERVH
jgi:hypothetical protein